MRLLFRLVRALIGVALAVTLLAAVLAGALTWRLAQGPLDVTALAQRLAARYAPAVQARRVTLAWDGFNGGPHSLHLVTEDPRYGTPAVTARTAAVALSMPRLLEGEVEPSDIVIDGLRLHATRGADGRVVIDGLPGGSGGSGSSERWVDALRHVLLHDAVITVADSASGQVLEVGGVTLDLQRRGRGGVSGQAAASLTLNGLTVTASLKAERDADATRLQVETSPVSPAALARIAPALAALAPLDAAVTLHGQAELAPDFSLRHAALQAQAGEGTVQMPVKGGGTVPAHFASASVDVEGTLSAVKLNALRLVLAPASGAPPTTLTLSGAGRRANGRLHIEVAAGLDRLAMADLPSLWPLGAGGGARPWLTENVTAGFIHDGHFTLTIEGATLDDLTLVHAGGTMTGDGVALYWLRPVPPVEHGSVVLTLESPDVLSMVFTGARQGRILERAGTMRIWGMSTPHQVGLITTDLAGPMVDVVHLLSYPKLNLLSSHPLPLANPSGNAAVHLTVQIPLENHVEFDDVAIHAVAQLTSLHLGGLVEGRNLDRGTIAMDVTNTGLKATGAAELAGIPSTLAIDMDFRDGNPAQVTQHIVVGLHADEPQLTAAGLDTFKILGGALAAKLDYTERRDGQAVVQLDADVKETSFKTPLNWSKTAGTAGFMKARAELSHGRLVAVDQLQAEAPGLSIEGHSEVVNGRPVALHLDRAVVGRTSATGSIRFPSSPTGPIRIVLAGPLLDLTDVLETKAKPPSPPGSPGPPVSSGQAYAVDLRFGQVIARQASIGPVTFTAEGTPDRLTRATLHSGAEGVQATLAPAGSGRHLSLVAADLGALLRAGGVGTLGGGHLELNGEFDDRTAGSPFVGTAELTDFRVRGAPVIGKVLQALTLYGLVDALRGPGLAFDRLSLPFHLAGPLLELDDARAFSSSLGVTARGAIDLDRSTLAIDGTVVPAYALNALPGLIPFVGRLFSPERGGGVFAATYSLHGAMADPRVGFNPLAALTPGVLRRLFGMLP